MVVTHNAKSVANLNDNRIDEEQIVKIKSVCANRHPTVSLLPWVGAGPYPQTYKFVDSENREAAAESKGIQFLHNYEKNLYFFALFEKIPRIFLELFSIILIIAISLIYLSFNQNFVSLLPILSLIIVSIVRFIPAFGGITTSITYMKMFEPSINLLSKEIKKINLNGNLESTFRNTINKIRNLNIKKSYFLVDNVSFKYPESKLVTLKNISMKIVIKW
mgnify:CR=1 FL=1